MTGKAEEEFNKGVQELQQQACIENYDVSNIDISTVTLNGVVPAENNPKYGFVKNVKSRIGDYDSDGIPDSIVKFKRSDVQGTLEAGKEGLAVTGQLSDGTVFGGVDTVRVI